jgi:uncharacterized protein (TIGR02145 family)
MFPALFLFPAPSLYAQSPQGIPYQAVMRNADGSVMASSAVNLTFMIHDGSATGSIVYQESHSLTSNAQGLVSCVVGNGTASQGNFSNINWGNGTKFLHVMMGTTDLGTQQMLSVPYALYAANTIVTVSPSGDTLTIGGNSVIVPGISAANPPALFNQGLGVTDIDGNFYPTIIMNGQEWMQSNLKTSHYCNGEPILTGLNNGAWESSVQGAYSIYADNLANDISYGKLYNWYAVSDQRNICPCGWHVPTQFEWNSLANALGGFEVAGQAMKSPGSWNANSIESDDVLSFDAIPSGHRYSTGLYHNVSDYSFFWSSTVLNSKDVWKFVLNNTDSALFRNFSIKNIGASVRCIKGEELFGCIDNQACNYNPAANQSDNSCLYIGQSCDDGSYNSINDVFSAECQCQGEYLHSNDIGKKLVPGVAECSIEEISVSGCDGQNSLIYDGRTYELVEIAGQCWFAENLATDQFLNGDLILSGLSNANWQTNTNGAFSNYNNDLVNDESFGKLYNGYAIMDSRGLCPIGWHIPTDCEWMYLERSLGMGVDDNIEVLGRNYFGDVLKSTDGWWNYGNGWGGGSNLIGFNAIPGGGRNSNGNFEGINTMGNWWTSTAESPIHIWMRSLNAIEGYGIGRSNWGYIKNEYSVRCLKN